MKSIVATSPSRTFTTQIFEKVCSEMFLQFIIYEVYCHIHYLDLWKLNMCFAIYRVFLFTGTPPKWGDQLKKTPCISEIKIKWMLCLVWKMLFATYISKIDLKTTVCHPKFIWSVGHPVSIVKRHTAGHSQPGSLKVVSAVKRVLPSLFELS